MSSRSAVLHARPAWRNVPVAASTSGKEAVELAASAGLDLDPWQRDAVCDLLSEDADGYWAATSGGLICPRQNGKGTVIEALELAWLFLCDVELIFHSAHLFSTSQDAFRRIRFVIENTPDLHRQVKTYSGAHGHEGIELRSGQRLRFVARSKSGGRGFPAPIVVLDEAFNLSDTMMAALVPTMAAQDNPFLLVTSSHPIEDPCSDVLRGFMRRGRAGDDERAVYIEYAANPGSDEQTQLREANPGWGVRLNEDVIELEQTLLSPSGYRAERLGLVDLGDDDGFTFIPADDWQACHDDKSGPLDPVSFGLAVSENREWAAIGVAGRSGRGGTHVELTYDQPNTVYDYRPGTDWLVGRARQIHEKWRRPFGIVKGSPAWALQPELSAAGVPLVEVSGAEYAQACAGLYDLIVQHQLRHLGQPALTVAAGGVVKRAAGDLFTWDRRTADVSPLEAVTVAKWASDQPGPVASGLIDPNDFDEE